ncbi:MAG: DUF721 domain-containing protein [Phycisphaerales bacterium]|nr:MAG: DUF721 domain-containing protein [Phycisphaerales bacterium]
MPLTPPEVVAAAKQIEKVRREKAGAKGADRARPAEKALAEVGIAEGDQDNASASKTAEEIGQLRKHRGRRERDLSISAVISGIRRQADRTHKKLGELIGLWEELVPGQLAAGSRLTKLRGGVLHVEVDSSAASYELDRLLRNGLEGVLRERFRGTLTGIRLRVGRPEGGQSPPDSNAGSGR